MPSDKRDKNTTYNNYLEESPDVTDVTETQRKKWEIKNKEYSNSANVQSTIVTTTISPTLPLNINCTSDTTAPNDTEQSCTKKLMSDASVASGDSSEIITDNKSIEKILLRHSPAAHVVTNDDLEDIEDRQ